jgi:hypothetical protein
MKFDMRPMVGLEYTFPIPSRKNLPTLEKTLGLLSPATRLPIDVLLPAKGWVATVPVVPGGVAETGIMGPVPAGEPDDAAVAPGR